MDLSPSPDDALPHALLAALAERGDTYTYQPGTVLINEGEEGHTLFIVLSGRIKAYSQRDEGREIVLAEFGPGDYVGELSLDGARRSASVKTLERTSCCVVRREGFDAFLGEHPQFASHMNRKLIRMARRLTEQVKSLAMQDVYSRITRLLMEQSDPAPGDPVKRVMQQRLTQQDIADRVGSSREMVHRVMKSLSDGGYVLPDDEKKLVIHRKLPHAH